jgi:glycerol kinase
MRWILEHSEVARGWAARGELALGTIDSYVMYQLSGQREFVTDHTNASRTMLYDLARGDFDEDLMKLFGVSRTALAEIRPSAGLFGTTRGVPGIMDGVPIMGCLGDQQAALFGHECDGPGYGKVTYGTGAFYLLNTGAVPRWSESGLLTSVAYSDGAGRSFAIEGSTFIAGAAVQFLRDNFKWFSEARESEALALSAPRDDHVVFVPALAGLGAPYWNPHAKGALLGLTRGTSQAQITRAVLESIALQVVQLHRAALRSGSEGLVRLGVDGGAARSDFLMQFQADTLRTELVRPENIETTAKGAARAARRGLDPSDHAPSAEPSTVFHPAMPLDESTRIVERWLRAVAAVDALIP